MKTKDNLAVQEAYRILYNNLLQKYSVSSHTELGDNKHFFAELQQEWHKQISESRSVDTHKKDKDFHERKRKEHLAEALKAQEIGDHILRKKHLKIANNHRLEVEMHDRAIQHKIKSLASGEVGVTILNQIKALDKIALMSWGAKEFVTISDPVFTEKEHGEGIKFKVNGGKFKGYVAILLNAQDLYNIFAYTIRGVDVRLKKTIRNVGVESLISELDNLIG